MEPDSCYKSTVLSRVNTFLLKHKIPSHPAFIIMGLFSTIWFLIRVIPRPSRASYPCMRAVAPIMSGFLTYLLGLLSTVFIFKNAKKRFIKANYLSFAAFLLFCTGAVIFSMTRNEQPVYANSKSLVEANQPIGKPKGIFPGRVVWVWDPDATNENCSNTFGNGWFLEQNTNFDVVEKMVADAVMKLTGKLSISESWEALFKHFNYNHGKGDVGYSDGEKIFIKVNLVSASSNTIADDYTIKNTNRYGMAETSPQAVLAILRQLVYDCGINQQNVAVGDPMKHIYKHVYELWHDEFPNITYIDYRGAYGRTKPAKSAQPLIYYSDRGTVLKENNSPVTADYLPIVIEEANYMINIAALKAHARAGVTLCAKNHFGSVSRSGASHLHQGLVSPDKEPTRAGYGMYRVQVDLLGHKLLGKNTLLFIIDGLWGGSEANDPPRKWSLAPFNNDWTSSIFVSQDQLALESVCFDFLKAEFTTDNPYGSYPQITGVDDYLLQAADSSYWPANIRYDPEKDGTTISSLGVHEHWNNAIEKQYSRNLGADEGIELVFIDNPSTGLTKISIADNPSFVLHSNYPNPFNSATTIYYQLLKTGDVRLEIINARGQKIKTLVHEHQSSGVYSIPWGGNDDYGMTISSGLYFCFLTVGTQASVQKLLYVK